MSEDDKTQKPTARRLEELRRDQRFPHSRSLSAAVAFGVTAGLVPSCMRRLQHLCEAHLFTVLSRPTEYEGAQVASLVCDLGSQVTLCLASLFAAPVVAFLLTSAIQTRGVTLKFPAFRGGVLRLAISRRRVLDAWGDAIVTHAVLVLLPLGALFWLLRRHVHHLLGARHSMGDLTLGLQVMLKDFLWAIFAIVLAYGIIDYARRLASFRREARMTREELAQEAKEQYGAPELVARRRELRKKLSQDPHLSPR